MVHCGWKSALELNVHVWIPEKEVRSLKKDLEALKCACGWSYVIMEAAVSSGASLFPFLRYFSGQFLTKPQEKKSLACESPHNWPHWLSGACGLQRKQLLPGVLFKCFKSSGVTHVPPFSFFWTYGLMQQSWPRLWIALLTECWSYWLLPHGWHLFLTIMENNWLTWLDY